MDTTNPQQNLKSRYFKLSILLLQILFLSLVACNLQSNNDAPVTNGWADTSHAESKYRVGHGETLYSIAWRYGLDYRQLIAINHLQPPYHISAGQKINILPDNTDETTTTETVSIESDSTVTKPGYTNNSYNTTATAAPPLLTTAHNHNQPLNNASAIGPTTATTTAQLTTEQTGVTTDYHNGPVNGWLWPVKGRIIANYTGTSGFNKGIDIAGHIGEPIHATAAGKVVYCGSGLRGYGQLIIIKHNEVYLSAYAHNSKLLVREGQIVKGGQVIALMGNSEAQHVMLHFEIRRAGKPVDPLTYLSQS